MWFRQVTPKRVYLIIIIQCGAFTYIKTVTAAAHAHLRRKTTKTIKRDCKFSEKECRIKLMNIMWQMLLVTISKNDDSFSFTCAQQILLNNNKSSEKKRKQNV